MKMYTGGRLADYLEDITQRIQAKINSETDSYILNVNVSDYAAHLEDEYHVNTPELHFDNVYVDTTERDIPSSRFPAYDFPFMDNRSYRKEVIIYHVPFTGDINLLTYRPNPFAIRSAEVDVDYRESCLLIDVINFYNDAERIKHAYNERLTDINSNYNNVRNECESYNSNLLGIITNLTEQRKQKILQKNSLVSALGVPIKKKAGVAETFSVPKPKLRQKVSIVKPTVKEQGYTPEPTLDETSLNQILKLISDVGQNLERMPSTYKGKTEEEIRDHIIMILDPNFELGSASGETFNKIGKTDICLRYDSGVVFIAECKYWKGEKGFLKTIDQLLGYLTWRNSKVAIINFVQNLEFTEVLQKVKSSITSHTNYLKYLGDTSETWFNYKFHLNGDRNREIDLAVISFHLPK